MDIGVPQPIFKLWFVDTQAESVFSVISQRSKSIITSQRTRRLLKEGNRTWVAELSCLDYSSLSIRIGSRAC